jgi:hypothetical protein
VESPTLAAVLIAPHDGLQSARLVTEAHACMVGLCGGQCKASGCASLDQAGGGNMHVNNRQGQRGLAVARGWVQGPPLLKQRQLCRS